MSRKTFLTVLFILLAVCLLATIAFAIYTVKSYEHTSIISFIAGELW